MAAADGHDVHLLSVDAPLRQAQPHPDGRVTEARVLDFGQRGSAVVSTIGVQP